ncbi:MAG TPA: isochorismatase family protein [Bacteroidales bacterium]|nr:isochorismatase family protein [Bacteroidales bacterium]
MESTQTDFISVINSILMLVDYKPESLAQIRSTDRDSVKNAVIASAKAASILNVPVILTSDGEIMPELKEIFPNQHTLMRRQGQENAFNDDNVSNTVRKYGREKLIISGLWTSESFTETALNAVKAGYDVFGLIDACGDTSSERHNYGVHRMLKAGVTPITWMSLASEWMNGWTDPYENEEELSGKYNAMLSYLSRH